VSVAAVPHNGFLKSNGILKFLLYRDLGVVLSNDIQFRMGVS
jgi:hypothetical protein